MKQKMVAMVAVALVGSLAIWGFSTNTDKPAKAAYSVNLDTTDNPSDTSTQKKDTTDKY